MLAASPLRSNVSPDDLQPAPVVAIPTRSANGLGKNTTGPRAQPDPAPPAQQHAVREQRDRPPLPIAPERRRAAVGKNPQPPAVLPGAAQAGELPGSGAHPENRGSGAPRRRPRQGNGGDKTEHAQDGA